MPALPVRDAGGHPPSHRLRQSSPPHRSPRHAEPLGLRACGSCIRMGMFSTGDCAAAHGKRDRRNRGASSRTCITLISE